MEVAVKSIVNQMQTGVIFTGECRAGRTLRVRVKEALFPAVGETYEVEGPRFEFTDSYGRTYCQIDASDIVRTATSGRLLTGYLTTLTGVGEARAKRLIDAFGDQINDVLQQPDRLDEIALALQPDRPALGRKLAAHVQAEFAAKAADDQVQVEQFRFYERLDALGVQDRGAARKLWRLLGASTAGDVLIANPYLAAALLPWNTADALGKSILRTQGVEDIGTHPERLRGAVHAATRRLLSEGHTAAPESRWLALAPKGVSGSRLLSEGLKCGSLIREGDLVCPLGAKYLEDDVSRMLTSLSQLPVRHSAVQIREAVSSAERQIGFQLTVEQRDVVGEILGRPLAALQGGAGVGKTTVMSAVTLGWEALGGNVLMAALAGKAALQLSRATSRPGDPRLAVTITRLINGLRAVGDGKTSDQLPVLDSNTLLIIDEASMVDTATLHELLSEIMKLQPQGVRLLFVGDAGQLPPVGFGAVFHLLVKYGFTSHLTKPLRQAENSKIPSVAAAIREGRPPDVQAYHRQMEGVQIVEPGKDGLIQVIASVYKHVRTYSNVEDVMVCAAKNSTVEAFNKTLSAENWDHARHLGLYAKVYPGDPIICTKNHYKAGLFNGMIGVVRDIRDEVLVTWEGDAVDPDTGRCSLKSVPYEASIDIRLAYAITCHKSQGSAAKTVIVAIEDTSLLTREWLYTAVTRARHHVILAGQREDLRKAVARRTLRITGFNLPCGEMHT